MTFRTGLLSAIAAAGALALAFPASDAAAQNLDAIKARKELLKGMGKPTKEAGAMLKGEAPFDLAKVQAALKTYVENAPKLPGLFPEDSKKGGETEALPVIWEKKKDFEDRFAKLVADAKAAQTAITDEKSFKAKFPDVAGNCGGCHKIYREQK
jgi:cytochrome c556